jgi:ATP-dependent protease ClpP protease subunit
MTDLSQTDMPLSAFTRALPDVRLYGTVDDTMFHSCIAQFNGLIERPDPIVVQLTTLGGAADTGRRIAREIELRSQALNRRIVLFGLTTVYSAGVTIMSGFKREDRFLSRQCSLLIHERQMDSNVHFNGPLSAVRLTVMGKIKEIEEGIKLQNEGFQALIDGSSVGFDEICDMARETTYLSAEQAFERGLVAGLI